MPIEIENNKTHNYMNNDEIFVVDPISPLVVLFGPATSGKTMALIRLTRYLWKKGYQVVPDKTFRPSYDIHYNALCESYPQICNSKYAVANIMGCNFLLVRVIDRQGRIVCQLLDTPGPYFFDPNIPQEPWRKSIDYIRNLRNKHVWLFFVEPNWSDCETREMYVERIKQMRSTISLKDRTVFVSNKIDKYPHLFLKDGMPNTNQIFREIKNQYPFIFTPFENKNPITRLFRKHNSRFVPFSAGTFMLSNNRQVYYTMSEDFYPKMLWKAICK